MAHGNYIISDLHFNHKKIIEIASRPFKSIVDMNCYLIENWNLVIKKTDTIYILGDFAFANKNMIKEIVSRLNGRKVLVMGNHDRKVNKHVKFWYEVGFDEVYRYPILYKNNIILSHEPVSNLGRGVFNIHGHTHTIKSEMYRINVCVEQLKYKPTNLDKLVFTCNLPSQKIKDVKEVNK